MASNIGLFRSDCAPHRILFRVSLDVWRILKLGVIVTSSALGIVVERRGAKWAIAVGRIE